MSANLKLGKYYGTEFNSIGHFQVILSGSEANFVVVKNIKISGLLYHKDIIENSKKKKSFGPRGHDYQFQNTGD